MLDNQTTIFEMLYPTYKITKPIRLIELFAGYGSQALALKYLGADFEHWKICEWAVKSIQAYKDLHCGDNNTDYSKDLTDDEVKEYLLKKGISQNYNDPMSKEQIDRLKNYRQIYNNIKATHNLVNIQQVKGIDLEIKDINKFDYIMTYSFPCQDLSLAGLGKGMSDTSTRSGLLWEVERILIECQELGTLPQILLMENVPQVHGEGNVEDFNKWQLRLEELGYKNYWQDLIATDYGIPQTRNRTFMVSILGDYNYTFPKSIPLKLKLKDMLEDNVAEKYYLSENMLNYIISRMPTGDNKITTGINMGNKETLMKAGTLTTGEGGKPSSNFIIDNEEYDYSREKGQIVNTYDEYNDKINGNETIGTIQAMYPVPKHGHRLIVKNAQQIGYIEKGTGQHQSNTIYDGENISPCLNASDYKEPVKILIKNATKQGYLEASEGDGVDISSRMEYHRGTVQKGMTQTLSTMGGENNGVVVNDLRIRKLTPRECFRLMGVKDEDYDKIKNNQSDSSLYHLAGDSIVCQCLMALFKMLME